MRALSWNCQGIRSTSTIQALKGHMKKFDSDFIFLMETKNNRKTVDKVRLKLGFANGMIMDPIGLGGLALWWKEDVKVRTFICSMCLILLFFFTRM